ncbi:MAG: hypothetical protein AAGE84_21380 [Cyanobacteria bacterium P01_G01_bin.39]
MLITLQNCRGGFWSSLVILPAIFLTTIVEAQTVPSGANINTVPNTGNFNSGGLNEIKPIRQRGSFSDSSRGSQQFFQQDQKQLFFLPEDNSEPILQIDEELEPQELDEADPKSPAELE